MSLSAVVLVVVVGLLIVCLADNGLTDQVQGYIYPHQPEWCDQSTAPPKRIEMLKVRIEKTFHAPPFTSTPGGGGEGDIVVRKCQRSGNLWERTIDVIVML